MRVSQGQGELFSRNNLFWEFPQSNKKPSLNKEFLEGWQEKIYSHQTRFFQNLESSNIQTSLFDKEENNNDLIEKFKPLKLTPLPLNFWRFAHQPQRGQAIYIVMDKLDTYQKFIILYIGETFAAEQRWKGDHDCKIYLDNYCGALQKVGIRNQISIRFWNDVPQNTIARRRLEQDLIQRWCPPFNKETRARWQTPFTTEIN
tara:strand:+ start:531 stop:1136 length:606 start_codon:yes stop_codon:yes gene_type:complete